MSIKEKVETHKNRYNFFNNDFMKEHNFEEWIQWAESTNKVGVANIEPILCEFLKNSVAEHESVFEGQTWNSINWKNISNSYRNMLTRLLLKNPLKYTYAALVGRSIRDFDYHGIEVGVLQEALNEMTPDNWLVYCEEFIPSQKEDAIPSTSGEERLKWIYQVLVKLVRLHIPNDVPAKAINDYLVSKGLLSV